MADDFAPGAWVDPDEVIQFARYVPVATARERLEAAGKWDALVAAVPLPDLMKLVTLREGLDPADPVVLGVLQAIGADPDVILAP